MQQEFWLNSENFFFQNWNDTMIQWFSYFYKCEKFLVFFSTKDSENFTLSRNLKPLLHCSSSHHPPLKNSLYKKPHKISKISLPPVFDLKHLVFLKIEAFYMQRNTNKPHCWIFTSQLKLLSSRIKSFVISLPTLFLKQF